MYLLQSNLLPFLTIGIINRNTNMVLNIIIFLHLKLLSNQCITIFCVLREKTYMKKEYITYTLVQNFTVHIYLQHIWLISYAEDMITNLRHSID